MPLNDYPKIILGHGGGGKLSSELIDHLFLPAFQNDHLAKLGDSTVVDLNAQRLAVTTDSYVVQPLFFPGGSIGELAINGTVNDLSMSGAAPLYLTASFILEEGFPIETLKEIVDRMGAAARTASVAIIAGDTKVVGKEQGDGCYINTSGIGTVPAGLDVAPRRAQPGDAVLVSGTMGDHGMAIMSLREGLEFETELQSDTAPLHRLVGAILNECPQVHVLRDPTRGGLAASLNEIARASRTGIVIEDGSVPVKNSVRSACELLGLDPFLVANEGKLICIVPQRHSDDVLRVIKSHHLGSDAEIIGKVVADHPGMVVANTTIGSTRVISDPIGEQLPRIC